MRNRRVAIILAQQLAFAEHLARDPAQVLSDLQERVCAENAEPLEGVMGAEHQEFIEKPLCKAHEPWLDASNFHLWSNPDPLKSVAHTRSEVLASAHGKSVAKRDLLHCKHPQYHEGIRIRGRVSVTQ